MSAKLLIVALFCAVAYAQAGVVIKANYGARDCSGAPLPFTSQNITTNNCVSSSSSSSAWFFDATYVYATSWYGAGCNGTVQAVTQYPIGCSTASFGSSYTTSGTSEALPFGTFPPSGFATGSTFVNVTAADAKNTACSAASGIVEVKSASNFGYCNTRPDSTFTSQPSSTKGFCNSAGTAGGSVVFSDLTCQTPVAGSQSSVSGCEVRGNAASQTSCGSTPTYPDNIPTTGYTEYSNADCTSTDSTSRFVGATCFDSQTLVCGAVNGTDGYATYTASSPAANAASGTCGGAVRLSHQVLAGTCVKTGTTSRKYFCTSDGPGASASTASFSMVALLIAAVAAVFSVRSL